MFIFKGSFHKSSTLLDGRNEDKAASSLEQTIIVLLIKLTAMQSLFCPTIFYRYLNAIGPPHTATTNKFP